MTQWVKCCQIVCVQIVGSSLSVNYNSSNRTLISGELPRRDHQIVAIVPKHLRPNDFLTKREWWATGRVQFYFPFPQSWVKPYFCIIVTSSSLSFLLPNFTITEEKTLFWVFVLITRKATFTGTHSMGAINKWVSHRLVVFDKLGPVGRGRCSDVSLDVNLATGHIDRGCHRLNRATFEYNTITSQT